MITLRSAVLRRGGRVLFENANLTIHRGEKVGVTGANGAGKSSLFQLLLGRIPLDAGDYSLLPGLVIAHVAQETPATDRLAIDYVIDGDQELRELERKLKEAERRDDGLLLAQLHGRYEIAGGYQASARAGRLLYGLGFSHADLQRPVAHFSGGWRVRLNLAQALMCRSDLLLLDEPTNHLDLDAVIWLQEWLAEYQGTLLLISHDRDFLDQLVDHVLHLENHVLTLYAGNFSSFENRRAEILAQQQGLYARQQREIQRVQSFVDRFRAKATKARQAQSRLKALERMTLVAKAQVDTPFSFRFRIPEKSPTPLLRIEDAAAGYGGESIVRGVRFTLNPGDRIGLLGANGAGKTTLVKAIAGELSLAEGERVAATDLKIGYFAQHQVEQLREDQNSLWHLQRLDPRAAERDLRAYLGGFGFGGEQALAPVGPFSGGEKSRLALALLIYQRPNVLLLDEPTNHLDLAARDALTVALQDFVGALILVSHDRFLLRSIVDDFWLVADGSVQPFDGDLDDYRRWLTERRKRPAGPDVAMAPPDSRRQLRRAEAERRRQLRPFQLTLHQAEATLDRLLAEQRRIHAELADPALYDPAAKPRLQQVLAERSACERDLAAAEAAWLEASEVLERELGAGGLEPIP